MSYVNLFNPNVTPQSEQADPRQVKNNAGGFSFALDNWKRLDRFLILGSDQPTYYTSERELTKENAKCVIACLDEDPKRAVSQIVKISDDGRAPKNDPAIFALALAASHTNADARRAALGELQAVCRTATHLFQFVDAVEKMRGWGPQLRSAIGHWYNDKSTKDVMYQVTKYAQRNGWAHRDLFRLAHVKHDQSPERNAVYRYIVTGSGDEKVTTSTRTGKTRVLPKVELPAYLQAFDQLKATRDVKEALFLIREWKFTHEMIPTELKNSPEIWESLLDHMPITATIRNLGKMTSVGLLGQLSSSAKKVIDRITSPEQIKKGRVHPIAMLGALKVYEQGHGEKGKLSWAPNQRIVDALDTGFYEAFQHVEPTGKRLLLALDVSGSMGWSAIAGMPGITPRVGSAAMAMVAARCEKDCGIVGFSDQLVNIDISPRMRLDEVIRRTAAIPMGRTDCALPAHVCEKTGVFVDAIQIYTDSETWYGSVHPHQALKSYRQKTGIPVKQVVFGMASNGFTIAEPGDPLSLDVVGFDSAAPSVAADFIRD